MPRLYRLCFFVLLAALLLLAACGKSNDNPGDSDGTDAEDLTDMVEQEDESWNSSEVQLPRLTDWDCPEGWQSVPGFVDEEGNENPPEGMKQFYICEPPESWNGPSGPVRLKNWECPEEWQVVQHEELLAEDGTPFSWCEPPESWDGPLGSVELRDWDCPDRWIRKPQLDDYPEGPTYCEPPP